MDSFLIRQLSWREPFWLGTEVADIVVSAKLTVGTGEGAVFSVDVCCSWKEVLACEEEAYSLEEELRLVVDPGVPEGCVG